VLYEKVHPFWQQLRQTSTKLDHISQNISCMTCFILQILNLESRVTNKMYWICHSSPGWSSTNNSTCSPSQRHGMSAVIRRSWDGWHHRATDVLTLRDHYHPAPTSTRWVSVTTAAWRLYVDSRSGCRRSTSTRRLRHSSFSVDPRLRQAVTSSYWASTDSQALSATFFVELSDAWVLKTCHHHRSGEADRVCTV